MNTFLNKTKMIPHKMFPHLFPILFSHLLHSQHEIIGVRFHPSNNDDNGGSTHHHRHFLHASSSSTPNLRHRYCTLPILFSRRKHALQLHPLFSHSQLPSRHPQRRWVSSWSALNPLSLPVYLTLFRLFFLFLCFP